MTNRVQVFRTPTTGVSPAAGTRQSGELWVNFADSQLGLIDASKNAQRLIAVRYFSASANYVAGDFVIQAGALYAAKGAITAGAFNAANWTQVAAATDTGGPYLSVAVGASTYLPLAGGTLTGLVTLSGPPSNPLHAATKAYVDGGAFVPVTGGANTGLNNNRIINGDMRIDQRGVASGAGGTAQGYTVDRWFFGNILGTAGKGTWQQLPGPASVGFPSALQFTSVSAYTPLTGDGFTFSQRIEADMIPDFAFGTALAQPVTLSFWVWTSGLSYPATLGGSIKNYANDRSYPFTYSVPAGGGAWTKIAITIPGDTIGAWVVGGNAGAIQVMFDLGSGATNRAPAGAWTAGNFTGANGAASVVAVNGAVFKMTGVKLEIGSVATPYPRQSMAKSLADCQRYYQNGSVQAQYGQVGSGLVTTTRFPFPTAMRAAPTMTPNFTTQSGANGSLTNINPDYYNFPCTATGTAGTQATVAGTWTASAEL